MGQQKARIWQEDMIIPTYELGEDERLPIFYKLRVNQGTKGDIYPYKNRDMLLMEKNDAHVYKAIRLENDYIRVTVLPELGGRIYEGYDKINDYNFVYKNNVIKPALIGLNGAWISGGIEFNWPQHHRPTTFLPVEATIEEEADGSVTAWIGETESKNGQKCLMGVSIHPDCSCITVKVKLYNPTPQKEAFHWWANLAVHVNDSYRLMFPPDIDYVTFHDKTHVSPFPVVKGEFAGMDYKEDGIDIRYVKNLPSASSFFIFDSQYSFMAGYDDSKEMGTVHIADRYLSPGKKFFTWGQSEYGRVWQKNLTDTDGDYIEIMTGCFTDNQPDFTWIMPYETKTFEQHWYSLKGIRDLKNATDKGAIGVWKDEKGVGISFNVTFPVSVTLDVNQEKYFFEAVPGQVYTCRPKHVEEVDSVTAVLTDGGGRELVAWHRLPMFFEGKEAPRPRKKADAPEKIASMDELWLNGMHLEQYKHATAKPESYYLEGLKRDPGDIRCNTALGVLLYRKGDFKGAVSYLKQAVLRSISRNPNPYDAECYYQLGLAYRQLGANREALSAFKRTAWSYSWKSAALLQAAEIECLEGDFETALADLESSLETNVHSLRALALRNALLIRKGQAEAAKNAAQEGILFDPLDSSSLFTLYLCGQEASGEKLKTILGKKTAAYLDLAEVYLSAGLYEEGKKALLLCPNPTALHAFYLAWTEHKLGNEDACTEYIASGEESSREAVFPNKVFDFTVLNFVSGRGESALAAYYLGCMLYARDNDEPAAACWQLAVSRKPGFADAHRALAQAMFECFGDRTAAKTEMEKAFGCSTSPRIFYEWYQLQKALGASCNDLLTLLENNMNLVKKRQDLVLQYIEQLCRSGNLAKAKELLDKGQFYTYEGGEGLLPGIHAFTHIALGIECLENGQKEDALSCFRYACKYPAQYHEGQKYQDKRAHLHYFLALGYEAAGNSAAAHEELLNAASQYNNQAESQYFKGLALRKLGNYTEAGRLFTKLEQDARQMLEKDTFDYFLAFPTALPFEQSQRRTAEKMGYTALFYAQLGLGKEEMAKKTARKMQKMGISPLWVDFLYGRIRKKNK